MAELKKWKYGSILYKRQGAFRFNMDQLFLILSLFFPRLVLLIYAFLLPGQFPANTVPQWGDILLGVFVPRVLVLIYIYQNMGADNIWFVVHMIAMLLAYFGGGRETMRRRSAREA